MFEKKVTTTEKKENVKEVKATKKAKGKEPKRESQTAFTIKSLVVPFILAAVVVCLIYIVVQKGTESKIVTSTAVCAVKDIQKNSIIEKDKVSDYLAEVTMDATLIPENAYQLLAELPDGSFYIENTMTKNQMVMPDDVASKDEIMDKYVEGTTKTSFAVDAFDNSISGRVRSGDVVNVFAVDPTTENLTLMLSDVYVEQAYDSSGVVVDADGTAVTFTVRVAPDEIEAMNNAIAYGGIHLYLSDK